MEISTNTKFIAYRRVSTQRQKDSGLGLEDQEKMISSYVESIHGSIIARFTETESGKKTDKRRPELAKALAACRKHKAILLVAKLDRLARNASFVNNLLDTPGVEFRAADCPSANRMMIQILAVFSEYEREQISKRTKAALQAYKARGGTLGTVANLMAGKSPAPAINRAKARAEAERFRPIIQDLQAKGTTTIRDIATALNDRGYVTERKTPFHATTVARMLKRFK